ncbi:RTX toxin acyltransferase family protein [compost metagenome]
MLGEIVWLMSQSPVHKQLFIGDLEWFAMPAILLEQFRTFYGPNAPAAVAFWAMVSEETAQRLEAGAHKLLAVGLGGCQTFVTTPPLSEQLAPLDRALTSKPAELEAAATSGDGGAEFGLSLVWGYGLHGYPTDQHKAGEWRRQGAGQSPLHADHPVYCGVQRPAVAGQHHQCPDL